MQYPASGQVIQPRRLGADFLKHYSREVDARGNVRRYYTESGFRRPSDRKRL